MVEDERSIARKDDFLPERLQGSEYFSSLSLANIYGEYTLKPGTRITTDIPNDDHSHELFKDHDRLRELAAEYGIPRIASGSYGGDRKKQPFVEVSVGMGSGIAAWVPTVPERGAIAALAETLSTSDKPTILDVGCGNGFVSKLFASEFNVRVIGIDQNLSKYEQLPPTPGDLSLREQDLLDVIAELGPRRSSDDFDKVRSVLEGFRDSFMKDKNMYYWGMQHGFFRGARPKVSESEIKELQELAGRYDQESSVDLVMCSFMETGTDLTPLIRDGIRPKVILYVKPTNGLSGIGDYYEKEYDYDDSTYEVHEGELDAALSFNPGRNYSSIARWQTLWNGNWGRYLYGQGLATEEAEVIVQVRNDVKRNPQKEIPVVRTFNWDNEIADIVRWGIDKENAYRERYPKEKYYTKLDFFQGIEEVNKYLLGTADK